MGNYVPYDVHLLLCNGIYQETICLGADDFMVNYNEHGQTAHLGKLVIKKIHKY